MRSKVYNVLKARFLVDEDAVKNWRFIVFLIMLAILMINNIHRYESKVFRILELNKNVKELRSEFVDRRSELMKLKMESTISNKMESMGVMPSDVPAVKIKVVVPNKEKTLLQKIWQ
ncbi:MAG: FtsL-like putative cell division protein [Flavobacteriaceae bacterium]|jgi:hypothetical protein|nr:FtsL-like putative cell division protein [Flavobacteriaceae bacterium]